jgi:tRNA-uridine 2-sulfurtransferase
MGTVTDQGRERVLVAMSGGVDSGVAAARLVDAGYDVVGVTLHLWDYPDDPEARGGHGRCCAPEDQYDARRTADALGFPHYTFDRRELFRERVVDPFVESYLAGETPSPCTACNRTVKLGELQNIAKRLGATRIATGHYALEGHSKSGEARIREGKDKRKDQSYFLYATPHALVKKLLFPLGSSEKPEVRAEAVARNLPGATKGESQELCFVGQGDHAYAGLVEERAPAGRIRPGPIVDSSGRVVGAHTGVHRYTVGQRRGLGVALGKPAFVSSIEADTATVVLGNEDDLFATEVEVGDLHLAEGVSLPLHEPVRVRVRYRHEGAMAKVLPGASGDPTRARIVFEKPVRAAVRGQVAVLYEGDAVLGGGPIVAVVRRGVS